MTPNIIQSINWIKLLLSNSQWLNSIGLEDYATIKIHEKFFESLKSFPNIFNVA